MLLKRLVTFRLKATMRLLSSDSGLTHVFDRKLVQSHRDKTIVAEDSQYYDYLRVEVARRLVDRLDDITRKFPRALDLGCHRGHIYNLLADPDNAGIGGIESLVQCDLSQVAVEQARANAQGKPLDTTFVVSDEEDLPFADQQFDLVLSSMSLHWVNDIPGVLTKIRNILKPDGAFIGAMVGGNSLAELRYCIYLAEQERRGGISPHTSPMVQSSDVAGLMQGAGFALPTIDIDTITIGYPNALALMEHLVAMGEGTAALNRQYNVGRDTFLAAAAIYQEKYGEPDGTVPATFQVVSMIGWSPDSSQPKPKRRGSAQSSLRDTLQQT